MSKQIVEIPLNQEAVVELLSIEYETIKIQVLDCRSNEVVKNANLKKITINGAITIENIFEHDDEKINTGSKVKDAQEALNRLGYELGTVDGDFGNNSRTQYNLYWEDRASGQVAEVTEGTPTDEMLDHIINEYNKHWGTDDNGILNVRIPVNVLDESTLDIDFGFWDFPIALEEINNDTRGATPLLAPLRRENDTTGSGTKFNINWQGNQSTDWGGDFGWYINNEINGAELKVSQTLVIKNDTNEFDELDENLMSIFYNKNKTKYHFNIFAMQWCQPVWDGIEDSGNAEVGVVNNKVYIQDANYTDLNMHIVTTYFNVGNANDGKLYGTTRHNDVINRPEAVDIHVKVGETPIFAVHGGNANVHNTPANEPGRYVILKNGNRNIRSLHMHSISIINNIRVQAGTILGVGGRTGNFSPEDERTPDNNYEPSSEYPDHTHLDDGTGNQHGTGILSHLDEVDEFNRACLPNYNFPLLLPCACNISEPDYDPKDCKFSATSFITECWVVRELKCPFMLKDSEANRKIQAQLRHLGYYTGILDGNWGNIPIEVSKAKGTRKAIYSFKQEHKLLSSNIENNFTLSDTDIAILDMEVPISN